MSDILNGSEIRNIVMLKNMLPVQLTSHIEQIERIFEQRTEECHVSAKEKLLNSI